MTTQTPIADDSRLQIDFVDAIHPAAPMRRASHRSSRRGSKKCGSCQATTSRTAVYCSACGKSLNTHPGMIKIGLAVLGLAVVFAIFCYLLLGRMG